MAALWKSLLDGPFFDDEVVIDPDHTGRIVIYADWPTDSRMRLTALFRQCVDELWGCLDSLVAESVEQFSVLHRPRNPQQARYFPIADSAEGLEALLAESCLDGVPMRQVQLVRDCQPFLGPSEHAIVGRFRTALRQLLEWDHHLEAGFQLSAWATPVSPELRTQNLVRVADFTVSEPGELVDERVVATFRLENYDSVDSVAARSRTIIDLCLPEEFSPADRDDSFHQRLNEVFDVVKYICAYFAHLSDEVQRPRQVLLGSNARTRASWYDATRSPRQWSAEELTSVAESDFGVGRVANETEDLILVVDTGDGTFERVIPRVSPVRDHPQIGIAAEAAIRDAAATWGLPDFVTVPSVERKGKGVREISDGLLVVGKRGVIVQSKARETEPGSREREKSWIDKKIREATGQVKGTARRLSREATQMKNGRGRAVRIDGPVIDWVGVVVIEHPAPPSDHPVPAVDCTVPVIVLLRRDWEFLFDQLRSTYAVVSYLHRVGESAEILGTEPERYYEFARADRDAAPTCVDPQLVGPGVRQSLPLLPTAPAGSDDDEAHGMVRIMLEDIATSAFDADRVDVLQDVLASIDSLPVGYRTELGQLLRDELAAARAVADGAISWRSRIFAGMPDEAQLGFAVCSELTEETRARFIAWLELRHHERCKRLSTYELISIGVLLTPRADGYREWDTTMSAVHGDLELTEDELRLYQSVWNSQDTDSAT
ncbi:hypothetical protein ACWF99_00125 [Nocardia sp. NPDC055002]